MAPNEVGGQDNPAGRELNRRVDSGSPRRRPAPRSAVPGRATREPPRSPRARCDCGSQLAEDVREVVLDRLRREEERRGGLAVARALGDDASDLQLVRSELRFGVTIAVRAAGRTGGLQLRACPGGPRVRAECLEQLGGRLQRRPRLPSATDAAQPLAAAEVGARKVERRLRRAQVDQRVGRRCASASSASRPRPCRGAERPRPPVLSACAQLPERETRGRRLARRTYASTRSTCQWTTFGSPTPCPRELGGGKQALIAVSGRPSANSSRPRAAWT